ncbi:MAG: hypothetical protein A3K10_14325 [Bacteroidetes bacterium RIFCSPLOWO2_12_FULL_31_6]|nr:MAG: hypothetical protein A3K10_14325 [Bacteroidetes bacterium RIFCSPLOWO2_12_FULL_31_6]
MKQKNNLKLVLLMLVGVFAFSCAKERSPSLHITVIDEQGVPASGATVHAWPGDNALGGTVNEAEMDKTGVTDLSGKVTFDFKFSAVLDVDVVYYRTTQVVGYDSIYDPITGLATGATQILVDETDSLSGHKVVKIESLRQKSTDNDYSETVTLK